MESTPFRKACVCLLGACLVTAGASANEGGEEDEGRENVPASQERYTEAVATAPGTHAHTGMDSEVEALKEALWYAAAEGNTELLRRLARDPDVDVDATAVGHVATALWIASQQGHTDAVRLLLARGADVEAVDAADGRTPLFQASQEGHAEIVKLLLEQGAEVEVRSAKTGATPLFVASAQGHTEVVRLLLAANADVNVTASAGESEDAPLSIARERSHIGVVELLEKTIAETGSAALGQ